MSHLQEPLIPRPEYIFPVAPNITGVTGDNPQFEHHPESGLYVRADEEARNFGERLKRTPDGSFTLRWWQEWSQDAWKERQGTPEASIRFITKLHEEYDELGQEIYRAVEMGSVNAELRDKIISESGDGLWLQAAAASNVGVSVEEAYRQYLRDLGHGMRILVDGEPILPDWHGTAMAQVCTGRLLTDHDVDRFLAAGYIPQPSTHMYLDPDDFEPQSPHDILHDWMLYRILPFSIANLSLFYYGVNDDLTPREEPVPYDPATNRVHMERLVSESMIRTLHAARVLTGATMGEIVRKNYEKLTGRVLLNLLDKTDGERPKQLQ